MIAKAPATRGVLTVNYVRRFVMSASASVDVFVAHDIVEWAWLTSHKLSVSKDVEAFQFFFRFLDVREELPLRPNEIYIRRTSVGYTSVWCDSGRHTSGWYEPG